MCVSVGESESVRVAIKLGLSAAARDPKNFPRLGHYAIDRC